MITASAPARELVTLTRFGSVTLVCGMLFGVCLSTSAAGVSEAAGAIDVLVNAPAGDAGVKTIQCETAIRVSPATGTLCVAYNDGKQTGFSRSTDGGATFVDGGDFPNPTAVSADPSLVWRAEDRAFYFFGFFSQASGVWRSDDDCESFQLVTNSAPAGDRPILTVDNNPGSPHPGRFYLVRAGIIVSTSDDGATWTPGVVASPPTTGEAHNPWPALDPTTGDVYVAYIDHLSYESMRIWVVRSMDGGVTWSPTAFPLAGAIPPQDPTSTLRCNRTALTSDIFIKTAPQIAIDSTGRLHIVYMRDPDGLNVGDTSDIFYRRSSNEGLTWDPEVRINDDATFNDQWNPTLALGSGGTVAISWYDRRNDLGNVTFDRYLALSQDGGVTWEPNTRLSDVSSNVAPTIDLWKPCYHGEYDSLTAEGGRVHAIWSDDRNIQNEEFNADVWYEAVPIPWWVFGDDFEDGTFDAWSNPKKVPGSLLQ